MTCEGNAAWTVDVVPAMWVTADGRDPQSGDGETLRRGVYALPSLPPAVQTSRTIDKWELPNFFLSEDRAFQPTAFDWIPAEAPNSKIHIAISLDKKVTTTAFISVDSQSLSLIRRLDLQRFRELQHAFWADLKSQNGCWFLRHCEADFGMDFRSDLLSFWRDGVLRDADVAVFAKAQLQRGEGLIRYSSTAIDKIVKMHTGMVVTPILPEELVAITWGASSLYPPPAEAIALMKAYSRNISGGNSLLRVTSNADGVSLFPRQQCSSNGVQQIKATTQPSDLFLPYPKAWGGLLEELFVPVYNLFDLRSPRLLSKADSHSLNNCRREFTYAKHLFLLTPGEYIKADMGGDTDSVRQFESEARRDSVSPSDQLYETNPEELLARQFLIMGCDSSSLGDVNLEWNRILEMAHLAIAKNNNDGKASQPGACGSFVHATFGGKAFVELRESVTVNGRLLDAERGIPRGESLGEALASYASLYGVVDPQMHTAERVDLVRPSTSIPGVSSLRLRFHAVDAATLDLIVLRQGDRIHAVALPEGIR